MTAPRTIPAEFGPRERHAATTEAGDGYWKVFDHSGSEFFGFETIASRLTERDARLLVFGAKAVTALNTIASWTEGREVSSSFDEPHSARIARAALADLEVPT
jgi:hypothetical protein